MTDNDCLFCKIVAGEIPSTAVAETDHAYAFRDISPSAPTHALVVPRRHVADVGDLTEQDGELLAQLVALANEVARLEGIEQSGYRLAINHGPDAGQTVFHLHVHVVGGKPLGGVAG